ncbi:MAG: hypothetical protein JWO98_1184 [Frankiales bacterium]|nr:hypothetical protein [Frankiales bacterium]
MRRQGWRGYLLPALPSRLGPLRATGIIAAVWAGWHLPQFFLIETYQNFKLALLPMFLIGLAGGAVVLSWLYNQTHRVLACGVWHALYNVAGASAAASSGAGVIAAAVWTFVVGFAALLCCLKWLAARAGRPSVLEPR